MSLEVQLILEQHGFKLHESTYTWIFFLINTTVPHNLQLVESTDVEPCVPRADSGTGASVDLVSAADPGTMDTKG